MKHANTLLLIILAAVFPVQAMSQVSKPEHMEAVLQQILAELKGKPSVDEANCIDGSYGYFNVAVSRKLMDDFYKAVDEDKSMLTYYVRQDAGGVVPTDSVRYCTLYDVAETYGYGVNADENLLTAEFHCNDNGNHIHYIYDIAWYPYKNDKCKAIVTYARRRYDNEGTGIQTKTTSENGKALHEAINGLLNDKEATIRQSVFYKRPCEGGKVSYVDYIAFNLPVKDGKNDILDNVSGAFIATKPKALRYFDRWNVADYSPRFYVHFDGGMLGNGQTLRLPQDGDIELKRATLADDRPEIGLNNYSMLYAPYLEETGKAARKAIRLTGYILMSNDPQEALEMSGTVDTGSANDAFDKVFSDMEQIGDTVFDFTKSPVSMESYRAKLEAARQSIEVYNGLYNDQLKAINESYGKDLSRRKNNSTNKIESLRTVYEQTKRELKENYSKGRINADQYTERLRKAADKYGLSLDSLASSQQNSVKIKDAQYKHKLKELKRHYAGKLALISSEGEAHRVIWQLLNQLLNDYRLYKNGVIHKAIASKVVRLVRTETDNGLNISSQQRQLSNISQAKFDGLLDEAISLLKSHASDKDE